MRLSYMDYAKAIGIILVVYGHIARGLQTAGITIDADWFRAIDNGIYVFHMPLFFFLSGVFFKESFLRKGPRYLLLSKADSILYPFIVWSLLQGGLEVFFSTYTNGSLSWAEVFSFAWQPRAQFWFLHSLFLIFCLFTLLSVLFQKISATWLLVICVLVYFIRPFFGGNAVVQQISAFSVFFAAGILFSETKADQGPQCNKFAMLFGLLFVIGQYGFYQLQGVRGAVHAGAALILAFTSIMFVMSLARVLANVDIKWLRYLGASSMIVYLMHILAGSGARIVMVKLFNVDAVAVHLVIGVAAGLILPLMIFRVLELYRVKVLFYPPKSCSMLHVFSSRT